MIIKLVTDTKLIGVATNHDKVLIENFIDVSILGEAVESDDSRLALKAEEEVRARTRWANKRKKKTKKLAVKKKKKKKEKKRTNHVAAAT